MPSMVRVRATTRMPAHQAKVLAYRTRMLHADITGGGEFELSQSDARPLLKAQWVEPAPAPDPQARRGPGRPPKARAEPEPSPTQQDQGSSLEDMTNAELRGLAEARGLELSPGYVRNGELIALLRGEG